jgi:hypothetical protein
MVDFSLVMDRVSACGPRKKRVILRREVEFAKLQELAVMVDAAQIAASVFAGGQRYQNGRC